MLAAMRRLRWDEGQTAAEYLGVLAVVSALIAVLFASTLGTTLLDAIRITICKIAQGDCETRSAEALAFDCTIARQARSIEGNVTIASANVGGNLRWDKAVLVNDDGRAVYDVTLAARGDLAARFGAGASVDVEAGSRSAGAGGEVAGKGGVRGRWAGTWRFESQEEADAFIAEAERYARAQAVSAALGPLGGAIYRGFTDDDNWSPPKPPRATTWEGGVAGDIAGDFFGSDASGEGQGVVGTTIFEDGTRWVYVDTTAGGRLEAGVPGLSGRAGAEGKNVAILVFDKDGQLAGVRLHTTVSGIAAAGLPAVSQGWLSPGPLRDQLSRALQSARAGLEHEGRLSVEAIARLDLSDPATRAAAQEYAAALLNAQRDPETYARETGEFLDVLGEKGRATADVYAGSARPYGFSALGALGLTFGAEARYEESSARHLIGWQWDPGQGAIVRRVDCVQR